MGNLVVYVADATHLHLHNVISSEASERTLLANVQRVTSAVTQRVDTSVHASCVVIL